ncbi:hypothetical protein AC578_4667 [Pseudocercospora eumusae]|uniref:Uncharacterized protein n=1 Tax=Pseudocercospora eumusae TaxID=321146 RepID=A0A139H7M3_9PEZI|nr:hypothetical protein AC578_4667 [Pseudocercospora eumusae]
MDNDDQATALKNDLGLDDAIINARDAGTEWHQKSLYGCPQIIRRFDQNFSQLFGTILKSGCTLGSRSMSTCQEKEMQDYEPHMEGHRSGQMLATMATLADALPEKKPLQLVTDKYRMPAKTAQPMQYTLAVRLKPSTSSRKQ